MSRVGRLKGSTDSSQTSWWQDDAPVDSVDSSMHLKAVFPALVCRGQPSASHARTGQPFYALAGKPIVAKPRLCLTPAPRPSVCETKSKLANLTKQELVRGDVSSRVHLGLKLLPHVSYSSIWQALRIGTAPRAVVAVIKDLWHDDSPAWHTPQVLARTHAISRAFEV